MRKAGAITAGARSVAKTAIADGLTTKQVNREVNDFIIRFALSRPSKGYGGFPAKHLHLNQRGEVIHGIPGKRVIHNGDIVSVDVGATFGGFVGDCAGTYPCGEIAEQAKKLIEVTRQGFYEGLKFARARIPHRRYRLGDPGSMPSRTASALCATMSATASDATCKAPEVPNYSIKAKRANPQARRRHDDSH